MKNLKFLALSIFLLVVNSAVAETFYECVDSATGQTSYTYSPVPNATTICKPFSQEHGGYSGPQGGGSQNKKGKGNSNNSNKGSNKKKRGN